MNEEICCYCGDLANTGDHIPPKSFFTLDERASIQLIKVPACNKCNNSACNSDEIFKFISGICAARLDKCSHDYAISINKTIINQNKLKTLLENAENIGEDVKKIRLPWEIDSKLHSVFRRIIKGLYYYETKQRLQSKDLLIDVLIGFDSETVEGVFKRAEKIHSFLKSIDYHSLHCRIVKKGVFEYRCGIVPDMPDASVWCLLFRNSLLVAGLSMPAGAEKL